MPHISRLPRAVPKHSFDRVRDSSKCFLFGGSWRIDTGYVPRASEIRSAKLRRFINRRWLINTHWHFDHADGSSTFADEVIANGNCRKSDEHCRCWMTKPH